VIIVKKTIAFILVAVNLAILSGCRLGYSSPEFSNAAQPPTRVPDTLEEQFEQPQPENGVVVGRTIVISYPDELPTERLSFSTPDRFSISFGIQIAVDSPRNALELLDGLPGERGSISSSFKNNSESAEAVLTLEFEDLNTVFTSLYSMGTVEEYTINVYDMACFDESDDSEYWHARWAENNTIVITFVERV